VGHDPISWYLANRTLLLGFLRMIAPQDVAEDAVQETYIVLQRTQERFIAGADPGAWVRGIARNLARQALTRRGRQQAMASEALSERCDQAAALAEAADGGDEEREQLGRCLATLSAANRELLRARYQEGLSLKQLAERSRRSAGAIQVALSRLRATLFACIDQALRRRR
jgi:RNA polymerase sigma-70 factor (ECF subfamily)